MSDPRDSDSDPLRETQMLRVNRLCNDFEARWQAGQPVPLEDVLADLDETDCRAALRDLLPLELDYRRRAGDTVVQEDYARRFPIADRDWLASLFQTTRTNDPTPVLPAPAPLPERLGDYQILDCIGEGGMGTVYKALHVRMGRVVALKILRPDIQQNTMLLQRFDREVRAAARLTHPNVVTALDAREQNGVHFLITEFIDGSDLERRLSVDGVLPIGLAVDCILQAARGLDYAHRQGVVHRDIKPSNLLRDQHGTVKILDMGLARLDADTTTTATDLTNSGMVLGTAAYMAPEQARDVRRADARSDIYSLGCTLYSLLIGRHAFTGTTAIDTVLSHLSHPIPSMTAANPAIPPELDRIFARMVAKDPADRYQTAAEVVAALESLNLTLSELEQTSINQRPTLPEPDSPTRSLNRSSDEPHASPRRRSSRWIGQAIIGIAGLSILAVVGVAFIPAFFTPTASKPVPPLPTIGQYALAFNGIDSYVHAATLVPTAGESYTIEAVVEPTEYRLSNVISWLGPDWMALYLDTNHNWGLARRVLGESHVTLTSQPATLGKTVHLAAVFRGTSLDLFADGQPTISRPVEFHLPATTGGLYIGGVPREKFPQDQNDRFFHGRIHAVRISNGARYTDRFEPPDTFDTEPQTLAIYRFHTGQGNTVKDESGHGHHAEIHNAKWTPGL